MKNIIILFVFVTISFSCRNEIDFSKTHIEKVGISKFDGDSTEIECYASQTIEAFLIDKNDFFGYYVKPIKIFLYINKDKKIRLETSTFCEFGRIYKIVSINTAEISDETLFFSDDEGNIKKELGGNSLSILLNDDIYIIFNNSKECLNLFNILKSWRKDINKK